MLMYRGLRMWKTLGFVALAGLALAACEVEDGDGTGPDAAPVANDPFSRLYRSATFQQCEGCHAPGAPGFDASGGTEATQDWSSRDRAYSTLQGAASGLIGNFEGCNGVPFLGDTPETSLIVAVFDEDVRRDFSLEAFPDCNADSISDMNLKIGGEISQADLDLLKQWIAAGAPNE
jgi:hypothetical protein